MRIADAQIAMEGFPEQAYDFSPVGVRAFVTDSSEPEQLDTAATMLNSKPLDLIKRVFVNAAPVVVKLLKMAQTTVLAKVKEFAGGIVTATIDKVINVLTALYNWAVKL
jgi:hypothetical protein